MNIHELSARTNISLSALKKLDRLKVLKVDPEHSLASSLRFHLARNQHLSVAQIIAIKQDSSVLDELGKYRDRALNQITVLGDVAPAPREVTALIYDAGKGDTDACEAIAAWLRSILPREPVTYHWVAVRLLWGLPDTLKVQYSKRLNIVLANVRKLDSFAGWYRIISASAVKNTVVYHKALAFIDM